MAKKKKVEIQEELVDFEVGEKYENMKGVYEVLSIDKDVMQIRWGDGEEIKTSVSLQQRIIARMNKENRS